MACFVLSGTALSNKFSISWSETLANGRDAIVFFFPQGESCQSNTGSFVTGQNRQENDFHWLFRTVDYRQIENSQRANQIHRFTIDYGKFILIAAIAVEE